MSLADWSTVCAQRVAKREFAHFAQRSYANTKKGEFRRRLTNPSTAGEP